jgi:hypothetical protein
VTASFRIVFSAVVVNQASNFRARRRRRLTPSGRLRRKRRRAAQSVVSMIIFFVGTFSMVHINSNFDIASSGN